MKKITLKISGMHCTSCSLNIDLDLEETKGVLSAKTNYAKSTSEVAYDPNLITPEAILKIIKNTGYEANLLTF